MLHFYYLIFVNVPNDYMLEFHISKENKTLRLCAKLFWRVWRTLYLHCHLFPVECYYQTELSYPHYRVPICLFICIYIINIMYHYSIIGCFRNFLCKITILRKEKREIASCLFITFQMMMYLACKQISPSFLTPLWRPTVGFRQ